jgi:hypothetical protein
LRGDVYGVDEGSEPFSGTFDVRKDVVAESAGRGGVDGWPSGPDSDFRWPRVTLAAAEDLDTRGADRRELAVVDD